MLRKKLALLHVKADDHLNPWAGGTDNLGLSAESFAVL